MLVLVIVRRMGFYAIVAIAAPALSLWGSLILTCSHPGSIRAPALELDLGEGWGVPGGLESSVRAVNK